MNNTPWTPSLWWHAKIFGVLLAVCLAALFVVWYATAHLPPPYQINPPAAQVTPGQGQR